MSEAVCWAMSGFAWGLAVGLEVARRAYRDTIKALDDAAVLERARRLLEDLEP